MKPVQQRATRVAYDKNGCQLKVGDPVISCRETYDEDHTHRGIVDGIPEKGLLVVRHAPGCCLGLWGPQLWLFDDGSPEGQAMSRKGLGTFSARSQSAARLWIFDDKKHL